MTLGFCQLHQQIIILVYNFNFDEKSDSRNLTIITKLHHFLKNQNQIETKKTGEPNF